MELTADAFSIDHRRRRQPGRSSGHRRVTGTGWRLWRRLVDKSD